MRLTAAIQLLPTPEQADALKRTLEAANAACDYISQVAWEAKTFRQLPIHRLTYQAVRETFGLAAQLCDQYRVGRSQSAYGVQSAPCVSGRVPSGCRKLSPFR
jgi:predicted transposase